MRTFKGYQKGINLGGWLSQCVSYEKEHFDNFIQEDDIKLIKSWGFDHVRLPVDYDVIEDK
jgi:aryl-phospho-beta-D-glucosidase BglC (GH1 family)